MRLFIFLLVFVSGNIISAQTLSNIDFFAEGKKVVITFDLSDCEPSEFYDVTLNFVEQSTLKVTVPKTISGDIKKLTCGSKRIVWDIGADVSTLSGRFYPEMEVIKAKKSSIYRRNSVEIEFVDIPAGTFTMGSPSSEVNRGSDEQQHQVTLSAFKMSKNEITFAQFDAFCAATLRTKPSDEGWGRGNRPVINVTWDDAKAFADWMGCRLPTEAEWEYACRAGTSTPFNTGNNLTTNQANYDGNYPYNGYSKGVYLLKTQPVGSYPANAWGLNDMHGNVWEWCSDWYESNYGTNSQTNPAGPSSGSTRVYRGGGWFIFAQFCRSSYRDSNDPSLSFNRLGFRLVAP
jgi:formylglycine-generating enzyme required for sulfatase activity